MNKLITAIVALALILGSYPVARVMANVSCSLPFILQNNTIADATQVMGNFNSLSACFASTATAGANNDITSLTALTSVSSSPNFAQNITVAGTASTGGLLVNGPTGSSGPTVIVSGTPGNLVVGGNITSNAGDITWNGVATTQQAVGVTPQAGSFTAANATINFKAFGKVIVYQLAVFVTTAGTGSGAILFTLPSGLNPVRDTSITGSVDAAIPNAFSIGGRMVAGTPGTGYIVRYDGASLIASGTTIIAQGWFENP